MKHNYNSTPSNKLLSYFQARQELCFNFPAALQALPSSNEGAIRKLLSDMTRRGLLMRLKDGIYYIIPHKAAAESFIPDWHLIAKHLVGHAEHYIGYSSALDIHDLIRQPSLKEQIVVSKQIHPSSISIKNIPFQFIYHNENHFFGYKKISIDRFNKVMCSNLEKTFIDCLFKPDYAGSVVEVAKAITVAKEKIHYNRLLRYVKQFDSQAVIKRLGFLLEVLEINTSIVEELQKMKTASYVVLDTELPRTGKYVSRWNIQQNLETETITSAIYSR